MAAAAPEPSGVAFVEGAEAAVESAVTGVAQARQVVLKKDAEGAVNIMRRLNTPAVQEYRALRTALHNVKAVAFLTQQCVGLGLGWLSGTGFLIKRLESDPEGTPGRQHSWSAPSYFRARAFCVGAIVGYEYVQSLVIFTSEQVLQRFLDGELSLGVNLVLMAGSNLHRHLAARPRRVDAIKDNPALTFSVAAGAMLNISVQVGWTSVLESMNRKLFGDLTLFGTTDVTPEQLLTGQVGPPPELHPLYQMLLRYTAGKPWS